MSVGKNIVAPLFERASGACGYYSGAALMRECRDRRMFTPGRVGSFSLRFCRGSWPAAGCFSRVSVVVSVFRPSGPPVALYRRREVEGAGRKGRTVPSPFGLGTAASSGQSIATSSNVSCPVMISSTAARVSTGALQSG